MQLSLIKHQVLKRKGERHTDIQINGILTCTVNPSVWLHTKGKAVPLQVWSGPEGSRKLRFPDFMTTPQDDGKVVSLTDRPLLPPENVPGTHFC